MASIIDFELPDEVAVDSYDMLPVLLGRQPADHLGCSHSVFGGILNCESDSGGFPRIADRLGGNDYSRGELRSYALSGEDIEAAGQLYNLESDPGETRNMCNVELVRARQMAEILKRTTSPKSGRTAPKGRKPPRWL